MLCFREIPVTKKIMDERGYQCFPSKTFCLTLSRNFVGERFCAVFQKISGDGKDYG